MQSKDPFGNGNQLAKSQALAYSEIKSISSKPKINGLSWRL
jgi:hypothetical protein